MSERRARGGGKKKPTGDSESGAHENSAAEKNKSGAAGGESGTAEAGTDATANATKSWTGKKWKRADFARGKPFSSLSQVEREYIRGLVPARGPQKAPTKVMISIRLSREVVRELRARGRGWQTRVDDALKEWLKMKA